MQSRAVELRFPLDLRATFGPLRHGADDPTVRFGPDGFWWCRRTPDGPATIRLAIDDGRVRADSWGPGAGWLLDRLSHLIGEDDDPAALVPRHEVVRRLHRRFSGLRIARTGGVMEALVPAIIEQKVTGKEAKRSYRRLLDRFGEAAPGPGGLRLLPDPSVLAGLPYYEYHPLGIEQRRANTIRRACRRAGWLTAAAEMEAGDAGRRLMGIPGIGPWTAAQVALIALGDADAVPIGDYHLPHTVAWALAGEARGDDARMLELLEPYRGQRGRVVRLLKAGGITAPRYGPRNAVRSIARL